MPDFRLALVSAGQPATILPAGETRLAGKVRLVSPEIDRTSRLGKVRVATTRDPALKIGAFARGEIETRRRNGVAIPASAVLYDATGPYAQTVRDGVVATRRLKPGLVAGGFAEILDGLSRGDLVITRAGAFLHDGDAVDARPATGEAVAAEPAVKVGER